MTYNKRKMSLTHNIVTKKILKPLKHENKIEQYIDKIEDLPGYESVNCRYLKSRNESEIYILSPKNMQYAESKDVKKMLNSINPDGIVLGCCLKRFKMFYNAYNNELKTPLSQYVSDFLAVINKNLFKFEYSMD